MGVVGPVLVAGCTHNRSLPPFVSELIEWLDTSLVPSPPLPLTKWLRKRWSGIGGGGVGQGPEIAQYQHLNNCIPDIPIASPYVS